MVGLVALLAAGTPAWAGELQPTNIVMELSETAMDLAQDDANSGGDADDACSPTPSVGFGLDVTYHGHLYPIADAHDYYNLTGLVSGNDYRVEMDPTPLLAALPRVFPEFDYDLEVLRTTCALVATGSFSDNPNNEPEAVTFTAPASSVVVHIFRPGVVNAAPWGSGAVGGSLGVPEAVPRCYPGCYDFNGTAP